jgi:hypothetical protein
VSVSYRIERPQMAENAEHKQKLFILGTAIAKEFPALQWRMRIGNFDRSVNVELHIGHQRYQTGSRSIAVFSIDETIATIRKMQEARS